MHTSFVFLLFHLIPSQIHRVNLHQTLQWIEIAQPNLDDYSVDSNIIFNHKTMGCINGTWITWGWVPNPQWLSATVPPGGRALPVKVPALNSKRSMSMMFSHSTWECFPGRNVFFLILGESKKSLGKKHLRFFWGKNACWMVLNCEQIKLQLHILGLGRDPRWRILNGSVGSSNLCCFHHGCVIEHQAMMFNSF